MSEVKKRGRNCTIKFKDFRKDGAPPITEAATFHCWGYRPAKLESKQASTHCETVAVCELSTGHIRLVRPENIQFTDVSESK